MDRFVYNPKSNLFNIFEVEREAQFAELSVAYYTFKMQILKKCTDGAQFGPTNPEIELYRLDQDLKFLFAKETKNNLLKEQRITVKNHLYDTWVEQVLAACQEAKQIREKFTTINEYTARIFEQMWNTYMSLLTMAFTTFSEYNWAPQVPAFFSAPFA
jgi:hypothetical protein